MGKKLKEQMMSVLPKLDCPFNFQMSNAKSGRPGSSPSPYTGILARAFSSKITNPFQIKLRTFARAAIRMNSWSLLRRKVSHITVVVAGGGLQRYFALRKLDPHQASPGSVRVPRDPFGGVGAKKASPFVYYRWVGKTRRTAPARRVEIKQKLVR